MTLIAGFVCPDGFVISADTEIGYSPVRYQAAKLAEVYRKGTEPGFWLVLGGAGNGDFLDHLTQDIGDRVTQARDPSVSAVDKIIRASINDFHDKTVYPIWASHPDDPEAQEAHSVGLLIGLRDPKSRVAMWRTLNRTVARHTRNGSWFLGSGDRVAQYVSETLFQPGLPVAVMHHLATNIVMEALAKGENVGGNVDTCSARVLLEGYPDYFPVRDAEQYLWGLEDVLNSAVRCALRGREDTLMVRINQIAVTLRELCNEARRPDPGTSGGTESHTLHVFLKHTHPFRD